MERFPVSKNSSLLICYILPLLATIGFSGNAWATPQETIEDTSDTAVAEPEEPMTSDLVGETTNNTDVAEGQDAPSNDGAVSREEVDALRAELAELKARVDEAEEEAEFAEIEESGLGEFEPSLNIYGFMAVDAYKVFVEPGSTLSGLMHDKSSFGISDLNIYFAGELTETMKVLTEIEFTFMPHGAETDLINYSRVDSTYANLYTNEKVILGGIRIVRAQYEWQPADFFKVTAGRYLTPFGIWNLDHGSTVVLSNRLPFLMIRQAIPLAQTGLLISGRFFPAESTYLDYGITVSNGRGPTSESYDLNEHKALGARLRIEKEWTNASLALGTYGFWSKTTDIVKELDISRLEFEKTITEEYWEYDIATDFLFTFFGGRIQAEYVRGIVKYDTRPPALIPEVNIPDPAGGYRSDYVKWDVYVLGAWAFPIDHSSGKMSLTPYFMYEHSVMDDTDPDLEVGVATAGLNFKPNSFVAVKIAGAHIFFPRAVSMDGSVKTISAQLAVSF